ncbi:hypothetical protein PoB_001196000 [Plakobranchus ocellatus]|uniref:Uncharacterized protein n=1 Tax=Plakobranchus ocellatus TaxID=259542 RepID=A0AAV3YRR4_9GAST|nr:hypothetical protein PoB_001196000 [Plakobranchus ocellatus]
MESLATDVDYLRSVFGTAISSKILEAVMHDALDAVFFPLRTVYLALASPCLASYRNLIKWSRSTPLCITSVGTWKDLVTVSRKTLVPIVTAPISQTCQDPQALLLLP